MLAALDVSDPQHQACVDWLSAHPGLLVVPSLCLAEAAHLMGTRLGWRAELDIVLALAAGDLTLEPIEPVDLQRVAELVADYRDLPLGTTDASIVAAAERLNVTTIVTLDRRHFSVVRPAHLEAFELVP